MAASVWRKLIYKLDKAENLELLTVELKSYKKLVNPEKIYLRNTNLMYSLSAKISFIIHCYTKRSPLKVFP